MIDAAEWERCGRAVKLPVLVHTGLAELSIIAGGQSCANSAINKLIAIKHAHTSVQIMPEQHRGGHRTALILTFSNTQSEDVICSYTSGTSKRESSSLSTGNTIALMSFAPLNCYLNVAQLT